MTEEIEIIKGKYPPNYELVLASGFNIPNTALFTFGNKIYNPSGKDIDADIMAHEEVHVKQQGDNPHIWCNRYLTDKEFRYESELEAYATQLLFCKEIMPNAKMVDWRLDQMATALSSDYQLDITSGEAKSKIRNRAKNI